MIHTHSKHCVMATLLYPGKEFRITHQEMMKGMKKGTTGVNYRWVVRVSLPRGMGWFSAKCRAGMSFVPRLISSQNEKKFILYEHVHIGMLGRKSSRLS